MFDVKHDPTLIANNQLTANVANIIPDDVKAEHVTNPYRGFWNNDNFNAGNPNNTVEIAGKHKSPHAVSAIEILDNGDILCYPPNVSVPYWSRLVFRNFDYSINPSGVQNSNLQFLIANYQDVREIKNPPYFKDASDNYIPIPEKYWEEDDSQASVWPSPYTGKDFTDVTGWQTMCTNGNYDNVPIFIKFDQYQSRSKVVFSNSDKLPRRRYGGRCS